MDAIASEHFITGLRAKHDERLRHIHAENTDLLERMQAEGVSVVYDHDDDTLIIRIGPPVAAATESIDNTVLVRVDPNSLKIVGCEVLNLRAGLPTRPELFDVFVAATEAAGLPIVEPSTPTLPSPHSRLAREIQHLVTA